MPDGVRFEVLGPLRARRGTEEIQLGSAKQQAVLAVLLLHAGTPVARDEIIAGVWGARPPDSAVGLVATYIAGLRRALRSVPIEWTRAGYRLAAAPGLDLYAFEADLAEAARGEPDERAAAVARALGRWRGVALAGVPGPHAERVRGYLAERRLAAVELRIDTDLARGGHAAVLPELFRLTGEHPRREPLHGMLMRALHDTGRTAEALTVFHQLRRVLVDELGVEPTASLRELHRRILLDEPDQPFPAAPTEFVGRVDEIARLTALVRSGLAVVSGPSGSGKTALALRVAHALAAEFPGGLRFADPSCVDEVGTGTLLVLDDVAHRDEIRRVPLGSAVLATSRAELDLPGVRLGPLDDESARAVLGSVAGRERVAVEPDQAVRIIELCAGMPRALRAASERLAAQDWSLRALADRMSAHDLEVRHDFHVDYTELSAAEARVFRLLGSLPGSHVEPGTAAALLAVPPPVLTRTLDLLAGRRLLEPAGSGFRFLPVPQLVAREHAARHDRAELATLHTRALAYYRAVAHEADIVLRPGRRRSPRHGPAFTMPSFRGSHDAIAWWEVERENLVALALSAARRTDADPLALATLLTDLRGFLHRCGHWTDWEDLGAAALRAAERGADLPAQALAQLELGTAAWVRCRYSIAAGYLTRSARTFHAVGDGVGEGRALNNLALVHINSDRHVDAALALRSCLELHRAADDRDSESIAIDNQAMLHLRRGAYARAKSACERSIRLREDTGTQQLSSVALAMLGAAHSRTGDHRSALPTLEHAVEIAHAAGNRYREAYALADLGGAWHRAGRAERAVRPLESALAMQHELNDDFGLADTTALLRSVCRALRG